MTVQITNGSVKYGRTVKTGDFEGKRGDVELTFNIPEGDDIDAAVLHVQEKAVGYIHSLLGQQEDKTILALAGKKAKKLPKATVVEPEEDVADDRATPPFLKKEVAAQKATKEEEAVEEENIDDLLGGEEVKEVTDKEITDAVQKCQARAKNAPAIRKLLGDYGIKVPPGRTIDVPQAKRSEFITKLDDIKPLA